MKCPRLVHYRDQELGLRIAFFGDCLQEECAWWDVKNTRCAMLGILCGLDDLFNQLDRLNDGIRLVK